MGNVIIEGRRRIAASPSQVYEILVDPAYWFKVDPTLLDVSPRDRIVLGSTGTLRNRRGPGFVAKATWTTTELVPDARVTQHLRGFGYELDETVSLAPAGAGTEMSVTDTLVPTSIAGRLLVALARGIMERDLAARFGHLERLLEGSERARG